MFKIVNKMQNPPKEGRTHPGLPCLDQKRHCRIVSKRRALVFVVVLILTRIFWYAVGDEHPVPGSQSPHFSTELRTYLKRAEIPEVKLTEVSDGATSLAPTSKVNVLDDEATTSRIITALRKPESNNKASSTANVHPKDFSIVGQHSRAETRSAAKHQNLGSPPFQRRTEMEAALERVITSLPGEMNMRDLLRPVEGTGKEKLHEMGLRTRSYRDFFQIWEDLHLASNPDGTSYVRDDIVQYLTQLRKVPGFATQATGIFSSMTTGQIIRCYETYKYFLARFGQLLFPYTSLHLQFKTAQRGIVLTAGDDQAHFLMTTIYSFRKSFVLGEAR
jgi:hypothetical protein